MTRVKQRLKPDLSNFPWNRAVVKVRWISSNSSMLEVDSLNRKLQLFYRPWGRKTRRKELGVKKYSPFLDKEVSAEVA